MRNKKIWVISVEDNRKENGEGEENETTEETYATKNDASYMSFLHVVTVLFTNAIILSPQMLIPRQNQIIYPSYWSETLLVICFQSVVGAYMVIANIYFFTNEKSVLRIYVVVKTYCWIVISYTIPFCIIYFIWVIIADLNPPMPFVGLIVMVVGLNFTVLGTFFLFPSDPSGDIWFKRKLKTHAKYYYWWIFVYIQREILSLVFKKLPHQVQPIIALMIPVLRNGNQRVFSKMVNEMAGKEDEFANVWISIGLNVHYAFFITIRLADSETFTAISIMAIDFLFHLTYTYKIVQIHNKVAIESNDIQIWKKEKHNTILKLVMAETTEGIVPLVYAVGFVMAYYGPNAMLIGNVSSSIWAYKAVEDVGGLLTVVILLFGIDLLSIFLNSYFLFKFTDINLIQEFLRFLNKYWILLVLRMGHVTTNYFIFNDVNLGMDMTTKFSWISDEGRMNFINSSIELSYEEKQSLIASFGSI